MKIGDEVRTGIALPGISLGTIGRIKEIGRLFIVVEFEDGRQGYYSRPQIEVLPDGEPRGESGFTDGMDLGFDDAHVPRGAHLCLLPASHGERIASIAWYLVAGLRAGEDCVCCMPLSWARPVRRAMAAAGHINGLLRFGRLQIISNREVYRGDPFCPSEQLERTASLLSSLSAKDGHGVRYLGYPSSDVVQAEGWWEYEARVSPILEETRITAVCVYDPDGEGTDVWRQAEAVHPYVAKNARLYVNGSASSGPVAGDRLL